MSAFTRRFFSLTMSCFLAVVTCAPYAAAAAASSWETTMRSQAHSVLTHRPAFGVGVAAWRRTDASDRPMAAGPTGMLVHAPTVGVDGGRGSRSFNHGCADPKPRSRPSPAHGVPEGARLRSRAPAGTL